MPAIPFTWHETDPGRPAVDVMVRFIGLDSVVEKRPLGPYLLQRTGDGVWSGTIELPEGLRTSYQICPLRDMSVPVSAPSDEQWSGIMAAGVADPRVEMVLKVGIFGSGSPASILELDGALPQPWRDRRPGVPQGTLHTFDQARDWPSAVHVYTPAGYLSSTGPWPVVVLLDGQVWIDIDVAATFDNLIADGAVPPFVVAMVANPFGPVRVRGLTRPEVHLRYLVDELMPWLGADFHTTADPAQTVLVGQSLGGLAAVHAALREPARFGLVVSQSGAFWWPGGSEGELVGEGVIDACAAAPPGRVRFWIEAGALENGLVEGNRDLHVALMAQEHDVSYREYQGGHDFACWRGGIGDGLVALLSGDLR